MKTPLALKNLWHDKARSSVAVAGVGFAVVLVLMQLGFLFAVVQTATRVYDQLNFDLLLVSPQYLHLSKSSTFSRGRLVMARDCPAVASVQTLSIGFNLWRNPETGDRRGILIMGVDPNQEVFKLKEINEQRPKLIDPDMVLMDRESRPEFGRREPGVRAELGRRKVDVVGTYALGAGFGADGTILCGERTFLDLLPGRTSEQVSLGLVLLKKDADASQAADDLRSRLPHDVHVFTRAEMQWHERKHWVIRTNVGFIFGLGVVVAFMVGAAIVYQVLSSDIANHLPEYATLKAMGYDKSYLSNMVLQQAVVLGVVGFFPGCAAAAVLYSITIKLAHIPMDLNAWLGTAVLVLSVVMCSLSGIASIRKVNSADPADLFR